MKDNIRLVLADILLVLISSLALYGISYFIFSIKNFEVEQFVSSARYLITFGVISSLFYIFHNRNLSLVSHILVLVLAPILALSVNQNIKSMDIEYVSRIIMDLIILMILDIVILKAYFVESLARFRNFIFIIGGILAYSIGHIIIFMTLGKSLDMAIIKQILTEGFNIYLFIGFCFGVGLVVHDQISRGENS